MKIPVPEGLSEGEKKEKVGKVADCFRTGYMIKGRLLRSAHVVVYEWMLKIDREKIVRNLDEIIDADKFNRLKCIFITYPNILILF